MAKEPFHCSSITKLRLKSDGSNDVAYLTRKLRGYVPAGVPVDEILDDLCKLLKLKVITADTMEARLEIFAGEVINQQLAKMRPEEILKIIGPNTGKYHAKELLELIKKNKDILLSILTPLLGKAGADVIQTLIIAILEKFVGKEAAKALLKSIASKLPVAGPWIGPAVAAAWTLWDLTGPASRKTIPLMLYLGVLSFRDGETKEFRETLGKIAPIN